MALFGYDQGVFSKSIFPKPRLRSLTRLPKGGVVISQNYLDVHNLNGPDKTDLLSIVTAIYDIGCFFGAIIAFSIGEQLGRKKTILIGATIMAVLCKLRPIVLLT